MHFVYVFSKEAKEKLLDMGYTLFQSDDLYDRYVFLNNDDLHIDQSGVSYILSDSLTL